MDISKELGELYGIKVEGEARDRMVWDTSHTNLAFRRNVTSAAGLDLNASSASAISAIASMAVNGSDTELKLGLIREQRDALRSCFDTIAETIGIGEEEDRHQEAILEEIVALKQGNERLINELALRQRKLEARQRKLEAYRHLVSLISSMGEEDRVEDVIALIK